MLESIIWSVTMFLCGAGVMLTVVTIVRGYTKVSTPSKLHNSDYTAELDRRLRELKFNGYIDINERSFREVAALLNSVVKAQQNCA